MIKKRILSMIFVTVISVTAFSQANMQLNFGLIGVSYEIPVTTDISIAPFGATNFDLSWLTAGVKGNYYFDNLLSITDPFDFYAGANAGYRFPFIDNAGSNAGFDAGLQVGGRWFWSEKMGLYLELGGGMGGAMGGLGLTLRL